MAGATVHERWMRRALGLAELGLGKTSPNPCVGALVVAGGKVLGEGWHQQAGKPHAEVLAVRDAIRKGGKAKLGKATLYVTLEPCCTRGRTPPCTDLVLKHRIPRVVVGATDPNPLHAGRGLKLLREAGVEVLAGVLADECGRLNAGFNRWVTTGKPWVIAKAGISLDGSLNRPDGLRWITGEEARKDVHRLRATVDAILIGAGTARKDNPRLTVRGIRVRRQPWRVVMARGGSLSKKLWMRQDRRKSRMLLYRNTSWEEVLLDLGRRGVTRLLVEGGARIFASLAAEKLLDEIVFYYAPDTYDWTGLDSERVALPKLNLRLEGCELETFGRDLRLRGFVRKRR
jgi:diaminohydroxyphosphoribosylaminopyrimidine deaminase/5-amino-6-(5-phosphoribosylamino)uracil reductase